MGSDNRARCRNRSHHPRLTNVVHLQEPDQGVEETGCRLPFLVSLDSSGLLDCDHGNLLQISQWLESERRRCTNCRVAGSLTWVLAHLGLDSLPPIIPLGIHVYGPYDGVRQYDNRRLTGREHAFELQRQVAEPIRNTITEPRPRQRPAIANLTVAAKTRLA